MSTVPGPDIAFMIQNFFDTLKIEYYVEDGVSVSLAIHTEMKGINLYLEWLKVNI